MRSKRRHGGVGMATAWVLLASALALGVMSPGGTPPAPELPALVARVQSTYDRTTQLRARFRQETRLAGFEHAQHGAGEVWIRKPGMMRWEYHTPERQTIIANGDTLWIYLPDERQVIRDQLQQSFGARLPALFLAGQGQLTELFSIVGPASQAPGEDELLRLELVPKDGSVPYARVELGIDPTLFLVARLTLIDALGNVTTLWFSDLDTKATVEPSLFHFQVPSGVDVIAPPVFPVPR